MKYFSASLLIAALCLLSLPTEAHAATTRLPRANYIIWAVPCTCAPSLYWHLTGYTRPATTVSPYPPYEAAWYLGMMPSAKAMGAYWPATGMCWMIGYPSCWLLPHIGFDIPRNGTALPGY